MNEKYCPLKFTNINIDWGCLEEKCRWWKENKCLLEFLADYFKDMALYQKYIAIGWTTDGK